MIDQNRQLAVLTLFKQGVSRKTIAKQLRINVKTVRAIVRNGAVREYAKCSAKEIIDTALLEDLYTGCNGYVQRMHEILTEEYGKTIGYSTLTRLVREHGLGVKQKERSSHVEPIPGEEMQHDTSIHEILVGGKKQKFISSGIYLRYSKMRMVRFYRTFNRFVMKCFIDEALRHWGYCARYCIIDNTNLAVLNGTGSQAVMNPEAVVFAQNYGFIWKAHALGHANRKAGVERNFWTVQTNFLTGRTFKSFEDLNDQAIQWSTVRYAKRPHSKTKLVPAELFETEKCKLLKLPDYITPPYLAHKRIVDEYGYCSFDGNFYWVPETVTSTRITVLQYAHKISIMDGPRELIQYTIAADGVKNQMFLPPGYKRTSRHVPKNRKLGSEHEEQRLRELGEPLVRYLEKARIPANGIRQYPAFIRNLYSLLRQAGPTLLRTVIERALAYNVFNKAALERMISQIITADLNTARGIIDVTSDYQNRSSYQDGRYTEENNTDYENLSETE